MKTSRSTTYGLLAVAYVAKNQDKKQILSNIISEAYNIPLEYLLKIMQQLTRSGILKSKRGPKGGFSLGRPADKITMLEIIEAIEGAMTIDLYLNEVAPNEKSVKKIEKIYEKSIEQSKAIFEKAKLSDLL